MLRSCFSRKHEAEKLWASHMQAPAPKPPRRAGVQQPRKMLPAAGSSNPTPVADGDDVDEEESESDGSQASNTSRRSRALHPVFPTRVHPVGTTCKGCGLYDCPSCACMCEGSSLWIDHPGGHFFHDCKKCGGTECPGCACVCRYSTVWTEHGGHVVSLPKKMYVFMTIECLQRSLPEILVSEFGVISSRSLFSSDIGMISSHSLLCPNLHALRWFHPDGATSNTQQSLTSHEKSRTYSKKNGFVLCMYMIGWQ